MVVRERHLEGLLDAQGEVGEAHARPAILLLGALFRQQSVVGDARDLLELLLGERLEQIVADRVRYVSVRLRFAKPGRIGSPVFAKGHRIQLVAVDDDGSYAVGRDDQPLDLGAIGKPVAESHFARPGQVFGVFVQLFCELGLGEGSRFVRCGCFKHDDLCGHLVEAILGEVHEPPIRVSAGRKRLGIRAAAHV